MSSVPAIECERRIEAGFMAVDRIVTREPFSDLFAMDRTIYGMVLDSIKSDGFREHEPIELWETPDGIVVIDGHTRLAAAKEAGIGTVPAVLLSFDDETAALLYAARKQRERRNLTDGEIYEVFKRIDRRKTTGEGRPPCVTVPTGTVTHPRPSREETAEQMGVSPGKVNRMRIIEAYESETGDTSIVDAVKAGELTITRAAKESRERSLARKAAEERDSRKAEKVAEMLRDPAVAGKSNRQIARDSGVAESTVRVARKRINEPARDEPDTDHSPRSSEAEPPEPATSGRRGKGVGIDQAYAALNCLTRIPRNDPFRERGLQIVMDWIRRNP